MARRQQQAYRALRPAMRSPDRPLPARHVEREFWRLIAQRRQSRGGHPIGASSRIRRCPHNRPAKEFEAGHG